MFETISSQELLPKLTAMLSHQQTTWTQCTSLQSDFSVFWTQQGEGVSISSFGRITV